MWRPEYFVRFVTFPPAIEGVTLPNSDGTFDIYINSSLSDSRRDSVLRHEIRHLTDDHFYRDDISVGQAEAAARADRPVIGLPVITVFDKQESKKEIKKIRCFMSLEALKQFAILNGGI